MLENTARGARNTADDPAEPLPLMTRARSNQSSHQSDPPETSLLRSRRNPTGRKSPSAKPHQEGGADINASKTIARDIFNVSLRAGEGMWGDALVLNGYGEEVPVFKGL
jgi:hypothetical protein